MNFAILVFPGSNCDHDCYHVIKHVLGHEVRYVWHKSPDLKGFDCAVLPGGFSYGDYLRPGSIARFSPVMEELQRFANTGAMVIGICNGFQILCEAGLLPGALIRNRGLKFICRHVKVRVETSSSAFTSAYDKGQVLDIPIAHADGNYFAAPDTLEELAGDDRVVFRYSTPDGAITPEANPNGSLSNIAAIINQGRNVLGMMPHPERASEPELGSVDGLGVFESMLRAID